jgi:plastocyanin
MTLLGWHRLGALGVGLLALACGLDSTQPPGPPAELMKSGGDGQAWYFNNPLPLPYSVTVRDANGRAVPGVSVDWTIMLGTSSSLSDDPSTTNSSGVATTVHTLGAATTYVVNATVAGLPSVTFSASASAPPTSTNVSVNDNAFSPASVVIQTGGTVTWTWAGANTHNLTFSSGPMPLPANQPNQASGTAPRTITTVGTYEYRCTNHAGMIGTVTVVN